MSECRGVGEEGVIHRGHWASERESGGAGERGKKRRREEGKTVD